MGYLQTYIIEYLRNAGTRTNAQICAVVSREYHASQGHVNVTLYQMRKAGRVERCGRGMYRAAKGAIDIGCERLFVAGALDRLETEYGTALVTELARRGWVKHE